MLSEPFVILSEVGVGIYGPRSLPGPWSHVLSGLCRVSGEVGYRVVRVSGGYGIVG